MAEKILIVGSGINQVKTVKEPCYAIDISQEYLDRAKKFRPQNTYIKADVQKMPFSSNSFDKVIFTHVLEHVPNPKKAISEIYRVLRKGGQLHLEIPAEEMEIFLSKYNSVFEKYIYRGFHKSHYDLAKLKKQLKTFKEVKYKTVKGKYIVFWFLWGKFISLFSSKDKWYIEECGQIHCIKYDKWALQLSRIFFIINLLLSPFFFRKIPCEYHAIAIK